MYEWAFKQDIVFLSEPEVYRGHPCQLGNLTIRAAVLKVKLLDFLPVTN